MSGRIIDDTGAPVTDARIDIYPKKGGRSTRVETDSDGRFVVDSITESGEYRYRIVSQKWVGMSWNLRSSSIQLDVDKPTEKLFTLKPAARVRLQTVDENGKPVRVSLYTSSLKNDRSRSSERVQSDETGWATIGGLEPSKIPYSIATLPDDDSDHGWARVDITLEQPELKETKLVVPKGIEIRATAICSDGNPPAGWRIQAQPSWWSYPVSRRGVLVGNDGSFTLRNVVPGEFNLTLNIPSGEFSSMSRPIQSKVRLSELKKPITFKIDYPSPESMTFISGRLRFPDGPPKQPFSIQATSEDGKFTGQTYIREAAKDFRIDPVPRGKYRLQISSQELEPITRTGVVAPSDDLEIEIRFQRELVLKGKLVDDAGKPVTSFRMRVIRVQALRGNYTGGGSGDWQNSQSPTGEFAVPVRGPGIYRVEATADGYAIASSDPINTDKDAGAPRVIKLQKGVTLAGLVVDVAGQPINDAKVYIADSRATGESEGQLGTFSERSRSVSTKNGRFEIPNLTPGKEVLKVVHPDFAPNIIRKVAVTTDAKSSADSPLKITLDRGATIQGQVFDHEGKPEPNVTLDFYDPFYQYSNGPSGEGGLGSAVTDKNGRYSIDHLPRIFCRVAREDRRTSHGVLESAIATALNETSKLDIGGPSRLTGKLVINGKPAAQKTVLLSDESPHAGTFRSMSNTDDDGVFTFYGTALGKRTLYYGDSPQSSDWAIAKVLQIISSEADLGTIEVQEGTVTIRPEFADKKASESGRMSLVIYNPDWSFGPSAGRSKTDKTGGYIFDQVPSGKYEATYTFNKRAAVREIIELTADNLNPSLTLKIPAGTATLKCKIEQSVLGPPNYVPSILIWSKDRRFSTVLSKVDDGTYEATGLPAGDYSITRETIRHFESLMDFSIKEGEAKTLDITSKNAKFANEPRAFAHVRVLTPEGIPLPGAEIRLEKGKENVLQIREQTGQYNLSGQAGDIEIVASFPGFEPARLALKLEPPVVGSVSDDSTVVRIPLKPIKK